MRSVNKIILIGHVAADPEVREMKRGHLVVSFAVGVNRAYAVSNGESKPTTDYFRVVAMGRLAEVAQHHVTKGVAVFVEGRLSTRSLKLPDGTKRFLTEIMLDSLGVLAPGHWDELPEDNQQPSGSSQATCAKQSRTLVRNRVR